MARLKNRQNFPPGGFTFHEPATGWTAPEWLSFDATVDRIIQHRQGNPRHKLSTDRTTVEWELESFNVKRLQSMKGVESYLIEGAVKGSPPSFQPPPPRKEGVAAGAKKVAAGIGVLIEWLGEGATPVSQGLAESRAKTCVTCEFNKPGGLTAFFTVPAADSIRKTLEVSKEMKLSTRSDDKLNVCSLCLCPLTLKVHVPAKHIEEHTSEGVKKSLPEWCWMKKEFTYR